MTGRTAARLPDIRFGRYRFHAVQGLKRGAHEIKLTPKSLAVLGRLLDRSGEVVTRDELFRDVWPDTAVSDAALTTCIQELRRALDDDARRPRYIETVHRRGFRFIAAASLPDALSLEPASRLTGAPRGPLVGRGDAMAVLSHARRLASQGRRQVVFVTGEPGIGKTALVEALAAEVEQEPAWTTACAECLEHDGAGEAYQPLLEALTRLCVQPQGKAWFAALRQCAPTWLAHLPSLQSPGEFRARQRRAAGATSERMRRELTDAFEIMTRRTPLLLCLEDLHWSDAATLDWIASFGRRPEAARVLVIGTYRPGEGIDRLRSPDAVAGDLAVKGSAVHVALTRLDAEAVRAYVAARFPPADGAEAAFGTLAALVSERTEGNPLFVVTALNDLAARGLLAPCGERWTTSGRLDADALGIPDDVRRTIEGQIDRQDEETRRLLGTAGIAGAVCCSAAIGAAARVPRTVVEDVLGALARRQVFVREGRPVEWPDGTVSATYEFLHSLYREVLSARLSPARRVEAHRAIGARLEAAWGDRAAERAAELASHFECGRDLPRAIRYLQHAAETDRSRSAHDMAERRYRRALALLDALPPGDERDEREVGLRVGLGSVVLQTRGWGDAEVQAVYERVRELSEDRGPASPLISARWHLWIYSITRGDLDAARTLADRLSSLAAASGSRALQLQAHHAQWSTRFTLGDLQATERHAATGLALCEPALSDAIAYGGHDAGICALVFRARALALVGRVDAAAALCREAVTRARAFDHPFTLAFTLMHVAAVHETRCDARASRLYAAEAVEVARERGLGLMLAWATGFLGWSIAELGDARLGRSMIAGAVADATATGSALFQPHLLGLLAKAQMAGGLVTEALQTSDAALALSNRTGERFYAAELHRVRGELRLADPGADDGLTLAERDFRMALSLARDHGARQLGLRAAVSLARLLERTDRAPEALRLVREALAPLTEGRDLPVMADARALEARIRAASPA